VGLETGDWNKALGEEIRAGALLGHTSTSRLVKKPGSSA